MINERKYLLLLIAFFIIDGQFAEAFAGRCSNIKAQMNSIARNAGWGDLGQLKSLEQQYYRCLRRPTVRRRPPRTTRRRTTKPKATKCGASYCKSGQVCGGKTCMSRAAFAKIVGKPIDRQKAKEVMPYAKMTRDVYSDVGTGEIPVGYQRRKTWQHFMRQNGVSEKSISDFEKAGFNAAIYQKKGEIVIAYRGTEAKSYRDWRTNVAARLDGKIKPFERDQYIAAAILANKVRAKLPKGTRLVLTGHSLGGALASHAGNQTIVDKVVTFNAARNVYSTTGNNPRQINVVVPSDIVGDPAKGRTLAGRGALPGRTYSVKAVGDIRGAYGIYGRHNMNGIIGGLATVALKKRRSAKQQSHCYKFNGRMFCD